MTAGLPPRIRPMTAGDFDRVLVLAAACPEAPHWAANAWALYLADAQPPPRIALVAIEDHAVVGFACATLVPDAQQAAQSLCELDSMGVHPAVRRRGIGAALLREIRAWAAGHGAGRLVLEVRASNAAALGLYRRFGLAEEGRRPRYYTDPEEDALLLSMPVTSV